MSRGMCLTGAVLVLAVGLSPGQERVALRQTYAPGKYVMSMNMRTVNTAAMATVAGTQPTVATPQTRTMVMTGEMTIESPDKDGVMNASFTYRRISYEAADGLMAKKFDSDDANSDWEPMAAMMTPLVGAKVSYQVTSDGNVQNFKGTEEVWDAMFKEDPGMSPVVAQMKYRFGNEQIRNMMLCSTCGYLPKVPVAVGETWESNVQVSAAMGFSLTLAAHCKLAGIEKSAGGKGLIDFDSTGDIDKPGKMKVGDVPATIEKTSMTQKGRLTFDMARNMLCNSRSTSTMHSTMTIAGSHGQKTAMSIVNVIRTEITIGVLVKDDVSGKNTQTEGRKQRPGQ